MMHAATLLDGGGRIVREVAEELGLDPFHFSRVFKRVHGVSPAEFCGGEGRGEEAAQPPGTAGACHSLPAGSLLP